jgi:predicted protein tyrosine phosphatase
MSKKRMNALWNCKNPFQGDYPKVLTICSAGLLRSATIAWWLSKNTEANVRNAGIHDYALVPLDEVLVDWADIIICSDAEKVSYLDEHYAEYLTSDKLIYCFDLDDIYAYRDPELVKLVGEKYIESGLINELS